MRSTIYRADYIFSVKNTASPDIRKVTEEQYVGKMAFILGNVGENGPNMWAFIHVPLSNPAIQILIHIVGFIVPIIVMRHRAKINISL